jgi:sugar lactone lactonase YvrE
VTAALVFKAPKPGGASAPQGDPEGLSKPRGLAVAPDGNLVIADSKNNRIVRQKPEGALVKRFGKLGAKDGEFREPCAVAVDRAGFIYVADTFHTLDAGGGLPWGRVQKFSSEGKFMASWGKISVAPNDLFGPRGIALDSDGNVYLADTGNHRIVKYGDAGAFVAAWGKKGKGPGEFIEPFGLAFDKDDNLYVADRLNFRVQVLNKAGKAIRQFKVDGWEEGQINMEPYLAIDQKRELIYVSDPTKRKVHRYSLTGGGHKEFTAGTEGAFSLPTGLALRASDGVLFITDGNLGRVFSLKP